MYTSIKDVKLRYTRDGHRVPHLVRGSAHIKYDAYSLSLNPMSCHEEGKLSKPEIESTQLRDGSTHRVVVAHDPKAGAHALEFLTAWISSCGPSICVASWKRGGGVQCVISHAMMRRSM